MVERKSVSERIMIRSLLLFLLVVFVIGERVQAQLVPPVKQDGFFYQPGRRFDQDTILIEAFFDPVCPDSRDSWPPLKQALHHYGSRVALLLHLLPLPSVLWILSSSSISVLTSELSLSFVLLNLKLPHAIFSIWIHVLIDSYYHNQSTSSSGKVWPLKYVFLACLFYD